MGTFRAFMRMFHLHIVIVIQTLFEQFMYYHAL